MTAKVNIENIVRAINTNDFGLALKNFKRLVPFLKKQLPAQGFVLNPKNLDTFISFARNAEYSGIEAYFGTDSIVRNWINDDRVPFNEFLNEL
jgi:aspartokinase-like uncharacterized kinase